MQNSTSKNKSNIEADEIIFLSLNEINCVIPENVTAIAQLDADTLVAIASRSLKLISEGEMKFNSRLPKGAAARHRLATDMARALKKLGYMGVCEYHQLLYPTEATTRPLLVWLIENLPRQEDDATEEQLSGSALFNLRLKNRLEDWRKESWAPWFCSSSSEGVSKSQKVAFSTVKLEVPSQAKVSSVEEEKFGQLPFITQQVPVGGGVVPASILEKHSSSILRARMMESKLTQSGSETGPDDRNSENYAVTEMIKTAFRNVKSSGRPTNGSGVQTASLKDIMLKLEDANGSVESRKSQFSNATEFGQEKKLVTAQVTTPSVSPVPSSTSMPPQEGDEAESVETEEERRVRELQEAKDAREGELQALQDSWEQQVQQLKALEYEKSMQGSAIRQIEGELVVLASKAEAAEKECILKQKVLEMLPNADENIARLQKICSQAASKMMALAEEWESHRQPMIEALRQAREDKGIKKQRCKQMVSEMKQARTDMQVISNEFREREERAMVLEQDLSKLPRSINRTQYTYRILDIIKSITKQKKEIARIIADIRSLQKEISVVSETLSRTEALADEKIFQAANEKGKDPHMVACYRHLGEIRLGFEELVKVVSNAGQQESQKRDLQSKIDQTMMRVSSRNTDRILNDLQQVQEENNRILMSLPSNSV